MCLFGSAPFTFRQSCRSILLGLVALAWEFIIARVVVRCPWARTLFEAGLTKDLMFSESFLIVLWIQHFENKSVFFWGVKQVVVENSHHYFSDF